MKIIKYHSQFANNCFGVVDDGFDLPASVHRGRDGLFYIDNVHCLYNNYPEIVYGKRSVHADCPSVVCTMGLTDREAIKAVMLADPHERCVLAVSVKPYRMGFCWINVDSLVRSGLPCSNGSIYKQTCSVRNSCSDYTRDMRIYYNIEDAVDQVIALATHIVKLAEEVKVKELGAAALSNTILRNCNY